MIFCVSLSALPAVSVSCILRAAPPFTLSQMLKYQILAFINCAQFQTVMRVQTDFQLVSTLIDRMEMALGIQLSDGKNHFQLKLLN